MPRNFIFFLATLTFSVSCSNLDNQNDHKLLLCGDAGTDSYALVRLEGVEDFDAILVKDGDVKRAVKTEKSCVSIGAADRDYRLLVRDAASKSRTLRLGPRDIQPGLSSYSLSEDRDAKLFQTQARCPSNEVHVSHELELFFKRSESAQFSYPMVSVNILDSQNASVLQTTRVLGDDSPALPLDLPDGSYRLEMTNYDAFDAKLLVESTPETCALVVDRNSPDVELKVERLKGFEHEVGAFTVAPASKLAFSAEKDEPAEVYVCLKKRADENVQTDVCDVAEFRNVGSTYNAPDRGAWDLYAYARDKAGNRSGLKHFKLNVYHDNVISEIHALSRTISLMVRDNLEYEAFKTLQKLLASAKKLELKAELRDVYWQMLAHFHWAATRNSLIWEQKFDDVWNFDRDTASHSLYEDAWAIADNFGANENTPSYIFRQGKLTRILKHYEEFQFLPDNRMVGIRPDRESGGMFLDVFADDKIVDSRLLDRFYEDVFIDQERKVFVLVGSANLLLIDMKNLDDQRFIKLPADASPYEHSGMELSTSPDSAYYYISVAANLLRVDIDSGDVRVYKDPRCWIEKAIVAPTGDVYYTGYHQNFTYAQKNCQKAYKINWDEATPWATPILSPDEDYDSLTVVNIKDQPFLIGFRSNFFDLMEFSTGKQYSVYIDDFAKFGSLRRHPIQGDVFYLQTEDTLYKMSLGDPIPWDGDQPFHLATKPIPIKSTMNKFLPTKDPDKVFLVYDHTLQIRTFQPAASELLPITITGSSCILNKKGSHSICRKGQRTLVFKAHLDGVEHLYQSDFDIRSWVLLPDGQAILLSKNNEVYVWNPRDEHPKKLGSMGLDGKLSLGWYPLAQVVTISHAINREFMGDNSLMDPNPRTRILTNKNSEWSLSDQVFEGLPMKKENLPVVLIGKARSKSLAYDVIDKEGTIINSRYDLMSETIAESSPYARLFLKLESGLLTLDNEPDLYSMLDGKLKKFNVYTNAESPVPHIPEEYRVRAFERPYFVRLEKVGTREVMRMNLTNGQLSEEDSVISGPGLRELWSAPISGWGTGILVEKWGEKLDLPIAYFFPTPDEFVVGYDRYEKDATLRSIIRIDPEWMDQQLKKSQLYELERKEVDDGDDIIIRPTPSPSW